MDEDLGTRAMKALKELLAGVHYLFSMFITMSAHKELSVRMVQINH